MEKNTHWRKCDGIISGVCGEYCRDMGYIGILWSWRLKPFNKVSQEHGGVKVGMRLKLKDGREVEVKGVVHFPTKYIVVYEGKEFQIYTHEVERKII